MLRILTWNSNTGFEKTQGTDLQLVGHTAQPPMMRRKDAPAKRKRSFGQTSMPDSDSLAVKSADAEIIPISLAQVSTSVSDTSSTPSTSISDILQPTLPSSDRVNDGKMDIELNSLSTVQVHSREEAQLATMRQTISSQLSLEILLKHRELRLIDQELAKCQVALEQLRRCSEIPYPALHQPSEQVSTGKGSAVRKSSERHPARSPAPWGVTDGPYTRHYAQWLLPDVQFDGGDLESAAPSTIGSTPFHGRSTRGHYTDFAQMVGKTSRSQRGLNAGLPAGFVEPKQKPTGPMILKRKSDGKMVKLVCPDCGRFDFGSAQGFINHCRIGHQRNFASHDAAAEGCGEPIEVDENGVTKGATPETITPITPVVSTPSTPVAPLVVAPNLHNGAINPLVRSAHLISKDHVAKPLVQGGYVTKAERQTLKARRAESPPTQRSDTPNLSAFVQRRGLTLNLEDAVADAKKEVDIPDELGDDDSEMDSPVPAPAERSRRPQVAGSKQPVKSTAVTGESRKSHLSQHRDRNGVTGTLPSVNAVHEDQHFQHFMPLVPSPTNESTQAPSLIDDDEDMDPQSPPSSDEIDESDVDFHVRDDEHLEEAHELRTHDMPAPATTCAARAALNQSPLAGPPFPRPPSSRSHGQLKFIAENPGNDDHNDKKRRRIGE